MLPDLARDIARPHQSGLDPELTLRDEDARWCSLYRSSAGARLRELPATQAAEVSRPGMEREGVSSVSIARDTFALAARRLDKSSRASAGESVD